jgi:hypothetical protein
LVDFGNKKERKKMKTIEISPRYVEYQNYFHTMSDELLAVWIEVAERRCSAFTRKELGMIVLTVAVSFAILFCGFAALYLTL